MWSGEHGARKSRTSLDKFTALRQQAFNHVMRKMNPELPYSYDFPDGRSSKVGLPDTQRSHKEECRPRHAETKGPDGLGLDALEANLNPKSLKTSTLHHV